MHYVQHIDKGVKSLTLIRFTSTVRKQTLAALVAQCVSPLRGKVYLVSFFAISTRVLRSPAKQSVTCN